MHNNSKFVILSASEESKQRQSSAGLFQPEDTLWLLKAAQNDEMDKNDHH